MERDADGRETHQGPPAVPIGSRIAAYEVEREIGRGKAGVVYRARDLALDRVVALKLLPAGLAQNEAFRQRFIHDSRVVAGIDHPHVVPIFDAGESDGVLYIAMRYVRAGSLRDLLDQRGALAVAPALRLAEHAASALDSAHAHGVVHGAVRPEKVLVILGEDDDLPQNAYLTGFGTAEPVPAEGFEADAAGDRYDLARVVLETLAGQPVVPPDGGEGERRVRPSTPPLSLSRMRPEIPPDVDSVMWTALTEAPADRYRSCREFVSALRAAVDGPDRRP
ncbi:serine/threonine-protein kinase [Streptomyces sp. NPDC101191]|uniref:serine/threonine-protein kinase n=1 Tax=Streptomyces sp. NPDC101191 TaxID=3366126 RepID=UPI0037FE21DB